jgi:ribonuclease P protein component
MQKKYRLKGERSFKVVYKRGKSVSSVHLVIVCLKSKQSEYTKFGLSVGKKVGKAVTRNLVKRRLRSILTELLPTIRKGYSYIIVARSGIEKVGYFDLFSETRDLFGRVKY